MSGTAFYLGDDRNSKQPIVASCLQELVVYNSLVSNARSI